MFPTIMASHTISGIALPHHHTTTTNLYRRYDVLIVSGCLIYASNGISAPYISSTFNFWLISFRRSVIVSQKVWGSSWYVLTNWEDPSYASLPLCQFTPTGDVLLQCQPFPHCCKSMYSFTSLQEFPLIAAWYAACWDLLSNITFPEKMLFR